MPALSPTAATSQIRPRPPRSLRPAAIQKWSKMKSGQNILVKRVGQMLLVKRFWSKLIGQSYWSKEFGQKFLVKSFWSKVIGRKLLVRSKRSERSDSIARGDRIVYKQPDSGQKPYSGQTSG